jgi:circadian clock protein KaiC
LDSVESLFAGLANESILRAELRRLFRWLKERNLTAVITGERGDGSLTRHGLEEYISDCVLLLDHDVTEGVFTRRLRVVKYRGSSHGTNEYPFLIDAAGISILPLTSIGLEHVASEERISSGVPELDTMLGGRGYYRGSSILISGTSGTGKTSLTVHFAEATCARGERCLMFSFEESAVQMVRNMRSIGIDLERWIEKGLLKIHSERATTFGLEMHLVKIHKLTEAFKPAVVVVDPITALLHAGAALATRSMLVRLIDFFKQKGITAVMTTLTGGADPQEQTDVEVSSVVDTWLLLRDIEIGGERNRGLYVLKARGLAHSNQIREFLLTDHGVELRNVYLGLGNELLTGSARLAQEGRDRTDELLAQQDVERKRLLLQRKSKSLEAQIAALQVELDSQSQELNQLAAQDELRSTEFEQERGKMAQSRLLNAAAPPGDGKNAKTRGGRK